MLIDTITIQILKHAIVLFYDEEKRDVREMREIFKSLEAVDDKLDKVCQF